MPEDGSELLLTWALRFYNAVSCMRHCKRRECNSQTRQCLHRKNNGKAAQLNKKPVQNYYCMSDISCLHHGDRLKAAAHGFHRTFIVNHLLVLYLQKSERALLQVCLHTRNLTWASSADIVQTSADKMNTVWAGLDNVYGNRVLSHKITWFTVQKQVFTKTKILYNSISAFRPFLWKG